MATEIRCDTCSRICGDTGIRVVLKAGVFKTPRQVFDVCDISCFKDLCQKIAVGDVEVAVG